MTRTRTSQTTRAVILLALGLLLAPLETGCGGMGAYPRETTYEEPEREDPGELESEQLAADEALSELLASPEPQCAQACDLGANICDLATRICGIAERHPDDEATATRCSDGRARCDRAGVRIAERCSCEPAESDAP